MAAGGVISGATKGRGGPALARHLADRRHEPQNDATRLGATRGIMADSIEGAIAELTHIVSHARSSQPLYHVHLDPEKPWTQTQCDRYWFLLEQEFGFENQPFAEAVHIKHGRAHYHRAYSRVRRDGTVIAVSHDYARRGKLGRIAEVEFAGRHLVGRHNRAVAAALEKEGRVDVLKSIRAAGLTEGPRPAARLTPAQRHQAERAGIDAAAIPDVALTVWLEAETGELEAAFAAQGLRLCRGDKVPVLVDITGGVHNLPRAVGKASAARGRRILAAEVKQRISELKVPAYSQGEDHGGSIAEEYHLALDAPDYAANDSRVVQPCRPGDDAGEGGAVYRRPRAESRSSRRAARPGQYRRSQKAAGRPADPVTRRKDQFGTHPIPARGNGEITDQKPKDAKRSARQIGRARSAEFRVECYLAEPGFDARIAQLEALADLVEPSRPLSRRGEELRGEAMLAEEGYQPALARLERLASLIVRFIAWIVRLLFGGTVERGQEYETAEPLAVEELSYPGPAP
jgi:hypothetical protein